MHLGLFIEVMFIVFVQGIFQDFEHGVVNANFGQIRWVWASLQIGEIWYFSEFFDCHFIFHSHVPISNCGTDFHALWLRRRVSVQFI